MSNLHEQRKWLEAGLSAAYRESDKLVVNVSSAVLALSVAFIGQVKDPQNTLAIKCSWLLLLTAIAFVLLSLIFEQRERESRISKIDQGIEAGDEGFRDEAGAWGKVVFVLNLLGMATFFLGLALLACFLISNLK